MDLDLPVTHVADIPRWSQSQAPEHLQLPDGINGNKCSPFAYNPSINCKVAFWTGDISTLDTHAVVACNNESLSDSDPQTSALFERAGPELRKELVQSVRVCRTGEVKLTKAYQLPSRFVIHTVGPRYNSKYKTAAENALFSCYRNVLMLMREQQIASLGLRCIHTNRRGYPSADGAHIAIRTVRRFLEKHGNVVDVIVFVVTGSDRETYSSLLPLYFPRSEREEIYASSRLPADVGSEDGEPVIAERKIRITANPGSNQNEDSSEDADNDSDGPDLNDILGTDQSIGEHAFAKMQADVDKNRHHNRNLAQNVNSAEVKLFRYQQFLSKARRENLSSLAASRFIYQSGFSKNGEIVVVYVARNLPTSPEAVNKVLLYAVSQMDSVVNKPYVIVYVHTMADASNELAVSCIKQMFEMGDRRYIANLRALYMLHISFLSKMSFWWWSTMDASDIKPKIQYIAGLEYLYARIAQDQLDLPPFVVEYDNDTYGTRYYNSSGADL